MRLATRVLAFGVLFEFWCFDAGVNGWLYFWSLKERKLRVIEGNYDNGRFDNNNVVLGVSKGNFEVFQISNKQLQDTDAQHKIYRKVELDAHYDDITFIEYESKDRLVFVRSASPKPLNSPDKWGCW